jgi:hypothetical protein
LRSAFRVVSAKSGEDRWHAALPRRAESDESHIWLPPAVAPFNPQLKARTIPVAASSSSLLWLRLRAASFAPQPEELLKAGSAGEDLVAGTAHWLPAAHRFERRRYTETCCTTEAVAKSHSASLRVRRLAQYVRRSGGQLDGSGAPVSCGHRG